MSTAPPDEPKPPATPQAGAPADAPPMPQAAAPPVVPPTMPPAIPGIGPGPNDQPRPDPPAPPFTHPPAGLAPRAFLAITALLMLAWFAWLSVAALNKSREPIVSRAQASVAPVPVRAKVATGKDGKPDPTVTVVEAFTPNGPKPETKLLVTNLPKAGGFDGEGEYLLLLSAEANPFLPGEPLYQVVAVRVSAADDDPPPIYKWSADVEKQARRLYRGRE
jgi:hypothetical protein